MKRNFLKSIVWGATCAAILSACGGSTDDEAGGSTAFQVVPTEVTVTAGTGATSCDPIAVSMADVFIYGGTAPYTVQTTFADAVAVSRNIVAHRGESFQVFLLGGCVSPASIVVTDSLNNLVIFKVTYKTGT